MYLKSLTISSGARVIRHIPFHKGLNLIVDDTPTIDSSATGNNVGKTTVLALVDYCLGGDGKDIYTDPENKKKEYKLVKDFLVESHVLITLILKKDLDDTASEEIRIERNFLARKSKVQRVNGVSYDNNKEFEAALMGILFSGRDVQKPTFRQVISHNVRYRDYSLTNTIKTLSGFTRDEEYETLYLFLLGCDFPDGSEKQKISTDIRVEETFKTRLEAGQSKSAYASVLALLEGQIIELEQRKREFNTGGNFAEDLARLNRVKYQLNLLGSELSKLNMRRNLITEAKRDLESGISSADVQQLDLIYSQARAHIGTLTKTFAELQKFHNDMVVEKINYITSGLPQLDAEIERKNSDLQKLLGVEKEVSEAITRGESFEELEKLVAELNECYRKKGHLENLIQQLEKSENALRDLYARLNSIDGELFGPESERKISEQTDRFNRFFSSISQTLYGEKYALTFRQKEIKKRRIYEFSTINVNFSSGKKQGEITCFDIAYTLFADDQGIPCMHFLLTDKKELMHDNQLVKIAEVVNGCGIQFVTSILRDKLPSDLNRDEYIVLRLSQADKLFRLGG